MLTLPAPADAAPPAASPPPQPLSPILALTAHPQAAQIRLAIADVLRRIYLPRSQLNGWEWCEKNIIIAPEESRDNHGEYSSLETIYVRRVFEFVTNPDERELIIRKSAQLGFTLAYMLIICYLAATAPTHVLYAMHSAKKAKEISTRLRRLLVRNSKLAECLLGEPEKTLHTLLLNLKGMFIVLTGSGSAGEFDAASFGFVALDELDRHKAGAKGSANTIDLARDRIKEVAAGKLLAGGTPEEFSGETNQNYLTGTREELHVECPHCHTSQPLRFEQLRFNHCKNAKGEWDYQRLYSETYYECINTACPGGTPPEAGAAPRRIYNRHKRQMLRPECVRWVGSNTGADEHKPFPGRTSLWINDLYSLREKNTWGHIAAQFIDAQKSPSRLRKFFNRVLGLPKQERALHLDPRQIASLAGGYDHGCVPVLPARDTSAANGRFAVILFADQQATCVKWVKMAFASTGEGWVIDYDVALERSDLLTIAATPVFVGLNYPTPDAMQAARAEAIETREPLITVLTRRHPGQWIDQIFVGGIDEGGVEGVTTATRAWCLSTVDETGAPLFFPTKGVDSKALADLVVARTDRFYVDGVPITVYHFADDDMKGELYVGRIAGADKIRKGESTVPALHLPASPTQEFCEELSQERRDEVIWKGKKVTRWIDPKGTNDYGDGVKGCLVMWHTVKHIFGAAESATVGADGRITPAKPAAGS